MRVYVGTSGWMYDWNPDGFQWFVENSGLNAIELNASFYRFPFPNQVRSWAKRSDKRNIRWSIKVNRFITHVFRFSGRALETWDKFRRLFNPLEKYIDFYLFQLPPYARPSPKFIQRLEGFIHSVGLDERFALEWRNKEWFNDRWVKWAEKHEITIVSVDSPDFVFYARTTRYVYVRMHGRTIWYAHYYTDDELEEAANKIIELDGDAAYVFFNNNHDMLENARRMKKVLEQKLHYGQRTLF